MLPPQLQDPDPNGPPPIPPEVQQKLAMLMQQHAALVAALEAANHTIETKQIEADNRKEIALIQGRVAMLTADLRAQSQEAQTLAREDHLAARHQIDTAQSDIDRNEAARQHAEEQKRVDAANATQQQSVDQAPGGPAAPPEPPVAPPQ